MIVLSVTESSQTGEARRQLTQLARNAGLDETATGRVALVATELSTNLVKHAPGGGTLLAWPLEPSDASGVEILALDRGPGMADLARCLQDGYSTAGSPGTGLGAASRLSELLEVHSLPGVGTAILSRITNSREPAPPRPLPLGALTVPKPGEEVSGDAWAAHRHRDQLFLLMTDGLGHGDGAATASRAAVRAFRERPDLAPAEAIGRIHEALRGTRGAAVAVAQIISSEGRLRFAGVGNIAGSILCAGRPRGLVSHNGTAGLEVRKIQEFTYEWPPDALLVLHSDGLGSRWDLDRYAGLQSRHPALIAGVLYRDFTRGRDDVTVAVVRAAGA